MSNNCLFNLSSKYSQKTLDHAKQFATDALKIFSKERFKKQQKQLAILIGNKIADKITRVSKSSPQNNSVTNDEEILKERYISPELRQKTIDGLRLI